VKVVFLEIDTEQSWGVASLGPAFIAPFLRREGHEVSMIRVAEGAALSDVVRSIQAAAPSILGLSLTTRQWLRAREVVAAVRAAMDVPVIAGGLHPTFAPEQVLATPGFDYVCLGEGEEPMCDLLRVLGEKGRLPVLGKGIPNIWAKGGVRPPLRPPIEPLDAMPFVARDLLDERYGVVQMTTQRGCPFPCTYCAARMYDELYEGTGDYGRRRSHENVLAEIDELRSRGQVNYITFLDDTFTIHHPWVRGYCKLHAERAKIPFSIHARVETVSAELLLLLAKAGCKHIVYGVESGSARVRREILRRPVDNQRFVDVFRWTREAGIGVVANYMLGIPGETRADVEETLALHDRLMPDDFGYFVFYPYPGTHLFKLCLERGYLPDDYLDRPAVHRASILNLPDLGQDEIAELFDRFTALRARDHVRRSGARLGDPAKQDLVDCIHGAAALS
jgi:anaerobic magnesium-protoporphyrin IX monomethyl ester cyclase